MSAANMKPVQQSGLDMAFPAKVSHLLPPWAEIPQEFKRGDTPWNRIVSGWFYEGLKRPFPFTPKEGINELAALSHIKVCIGSFEPTHEHKEAGSAYLMSLWFDLPQAARR